MYVVRTTCGLRQLQRSVKVSDEVIDILDTDAETEHVRVNSGGYLLLRAELGVSGGCRMNDERLGISYAAYVEDELQTGDE